MSAVSSNGDRSPGRRLRPQAIAPYLFISPFVILFCVFGAWPILKSASLSLYVTNGPRNSIFRGFDNYRFLFADADFGTAAWNTLTYAICSICVQLPCSLGLALLLNARWIRGRGLLRLAFFSPNLMGQVFVGVLFSVLFIPKYGFLNRAIHSVFSAVPLDTKWLANPALVMPALVLTSLWMYVGFNMIYFLAALQSVDPELYDAAKIDGAGAPARFAAITLPGIRPVAAFVLVTSTIGSFQLFELPWIMLGNSAGPNNSGLTMVMYLYHFGFEIGDLGYASAVGWVLAAALLLISLAQMRLTGQWKGASE